VQHGVEPEGESSGIVCSILAQAASANDGENNGPSEAGNGGASETQVYQAPDREKHAFEEAEAQAEAYAASQGGDADGEEEEVSPSSGADAYDDPLSSTAPQGYNTGALSGTSTGGYTDEYSDDGSSTGGYTDEYSDDGSSGSVTGSISSVFDGSSGSRMPEAVKKTSQRSLLADNGCEESVNNLACPNGYQSTGTPRNLFFQVGSLCVTVQTEMCQCAIADNNGCPAACTDIIPEKDRRSGEVSMWKTVGSGSFKAFFRGYAQSKPNDADTEVSVVQKLKTEYSAFLSRRTTEIEAMKCG